MVEPLVDMYHIQLPHGTLFVANVKLMPQLQRAYTKLTFRI